MKRESHTKRSQAGVQGPEITVVRCPSRMAERSTVPARGANEATAPNSEISGTSRWGRTSRKPRESYQTKPTKRSQAGEPGLEIRADCYPPEWPNESAAPGPSCSEASAAVQLSPSEDEMCAVQLLIADDRENVRRSERQEITPAASVKSGWLGGDPGRSIAGAGRVSGGSEWKCLFFPW